MIIHYLNTAIRNLRNNKVPAVINIAGLAIALVASITIFDWVKYELSYDGFHKDADRLYRLALKGESVPEVALSPATKPLLLDKIAEIEQSVRLFRAGFMGGKTKVAFEERVFTDNEIIYTDDNFFEIFSLKLLSGDKHSALQKPNAVILTEETAAKYFGEVDPLGKTLVISDGNTLEVTGVAESLPTNLHFSFDMLVSLKSHPWGDVDKISLGSSYAFYNYFKVHHDASIDVIPAKLKQLVEDMNLSWNWNPEFLIQPVTAIHLQSNGESEMAANNNIKTISVFLTIGFLIIIVAGINYVNLTTTNSIKRSKEVGIRKTIGAGRKQLILTFLFESLISVTVAFILAFTLHILVRPLLSELITQHDTHRMWFTLFIPTVIILGFGIGIFPAIILSRLKPVNMIKSGLIPAQKEFGFKRVLLTFQFCTSVVLILATIVINRQMKYIQNKNLGYDQEQMLVLDIGFPELRNRVDILKESLAGIPDVINSTAVSQLPGNIMTGEGVNLPPDGERIEVTFMMVDKEFFNTLSVDIIAGKDQVDLIDTDKNYDWRTVKNHFVVNKAFVDEMEITADQAIGQEIIIRHGNMDPGPITGVIGNFHNQSLHHEIGPLVLEFLPGRFQHLIIKLETTETRKTMTDIERCWKEVAGNLPFDYRFLDEEYNNLYESETRSGLLLLIFSVISVLIAGTGLFGLSILLIESKTKEIGIRKVTGAKIPDILTMLSKNFTRWIIVANVIAWPGAYYILGLWLNNFAYRISITIWHFLLAGLTVFVFAMLTISIRAIRASLANPVDSLKYE